MQEFSPRVSKDLYELVAPQYAKKSIESDYLAFRDLPEILAPFKHRRALDFGCGAGRSTGFLAELEIEALGYDRSPAMIQEAKRGSAALSFLNSLEEVSALAPFDLVFSSFMVCTIPTSVQLEQVFQEISVQLASSGKAVIVTTNPDFYFRPYLNCINYPPSNLSEIRSGLQVQIELLPERVQLLDTIWFANDLERAANRAGLALERTHMPLGRETDGVLWLSETEHPPFAIYQFKKVSALNQQ